MKISFSVGGGWKIAEVAKYLQGWVKLQQCILVKILVNNVTPFKSLN